MIAAAAMALSSLSVVMNANRLRTFHAPALPAEGTTTDHVTVEVHEHEERKEEAMATVKDPVCGMEIDPSAAAASDEYEGPDLLLLLRELPSEVVADPQQFAA